MFHAEVFPVMLVKCLVPEVKRVAEPKERLQKFKALVWGQFKLFYKFGNKEFSGEWFGGLQVCLSTSEVQMSNP